MVELAWRGPVTTGHTRLVSLSKYSVNYLQTANKKSNICMQKINKNKTLRRLKVQGFLWVDEKKILNNIITNY